MDRFELPPDLAELERQLAGRPWPKPTAGFRPRLLAMVGRELNLGAASSASESMWRFAAAVAAAALLWINLSMSIANHMDWPFSGSLERGRLEATAARIRTLFPEMGAREALRQALLLQARTRLVPVADFQLSADQILRYKERVTWAIR